MLRVTLILMAMERLLAVCVFDPALNCRIWEPLLAVIREQQAYFSATGGENMPEHDGAVLGEHYSHKISAEFDSQIAASRAVESLKVAGIPREQIRVVQPHDPHMGTR
ncbi:hypothetical protein BCA33_01715 [Marinobacter sp. AC-23]|nr:hypothetical protein BCA33_01715 [Marinobacter sp. AC-23]